MQNLTYVTDFEFKPSGLLLTAYIDEQNHPRIFCGTGEYPNAEHLLFGTAIECDTQAESAAAIQAEIDNACAEYPNVFAKAR